MSSNCFVQKPVASKIPSKEVYDIVTKLWGKKCVAKTGKEQVVFLHINEERSTYGVVQPSKKK